MDENPITGKRERIEALKEQASGDGPPDKLSLLRQKLSQKAKQAAFNCLCMPATIRFQESRMPGNPLVRFDEGRVGRTSVSPSLLLYRPSDFA